ncbi:MAG: hypothetical protein Fur0046_34340 [Cyanobacteria bacterium J069]|nr:MAG: hypothetical protein D6742_06240 [Cyanobacteria bacterium J069]
MIAKISGKKETFCSVVQGESSSVPAETAIPHAAKIATVSETSRLNIRSQPIANPLRNRVNAGDRKSDKVPESVPIERDLMETISLKLQLTPNKVETQCTEDQHSNAPETRN